MKTQYLFTVVLLVVLALAGSVSVGFSQAPVASYGNTTGQSVPGSTSNGIVLLHPATLYLPLLSRP